MANYLFLNYMVILDWDLFFTLNLFKASSSFIISFCYQSEPYSYSFIFAGFQNLTCYLSLVLYQFKQLSLLVWLYHWLCACLYHQIFYGQLDQGIHSWQFRSISQSRTEFLGFRLFSYSKYWLSIIGKTVDISSKFLHPDIINQF